MKQHNVFVCLIKQTLAKMTDIQTIYIVFETTGDEWNPELQVKLTRLDSQLWELESCWYFGSSDEDQCRPKAMTYDRFCDVYNKALYICNTHYTGAGQHSCVCISFAEMGAELKTYEIVDDMLEQFRAYMVDLKNRILHSDTLISAKKTRRSRRKSKKSKSVGLLTANMLS
jgi:hypothetical protein